MKVALSFRRLHPEPWESIHEKYHVGQTVTATVTKVTTFGAFARLDPAIEGLVHISELSDGPVRHPSDIVSEGQELTLKILRIEPERRRLALSLKQLALTVSPSATGMSSMVRTKWGTEDTTTSPAKTHLLDVVTCVQLGAAHGQ